MTAKDVNIEELKNLPKASPTADVVLSTLASRMRLRHFTDLTRLKTILISEGKKIVNEDFMSLFQSLERLGIGSVVYGRKNKPDRFEWFYSLKDVGKAALNRPYDALNRMNVVEMSPRRKVKNLPAEAPQTTAIASPAATSDTNRVFIYIRPKLTLDLALPTDMSDDEIIMVSEAIRKSVGR